MNKTFAESVNVVEFEKKELRKKSGQKIRKWKKCISKH